MPKMRDIHERKLITKNWPLPFEAIQEMKQFIVYGDVSEIAKELDVSIFKIWDYLNRERSKYDLKVMIAILERAERNQTIMDPKTLSRRWRFSLRMYINKIYRHYSTKETKDVRNRLQEAEAV
jgi:hypothetical protein